MSYPNYPSYSGGQGYPYPPNQQNQQYPAGYPPYPSNTGYPGYPPQPQAQPYYPAPGGAGYPPAPYNQQQPGFPAAPTGVSYQNPAPYGLHPSSGHPNPGQYSSYASAAPYAYQQQAGISYQQPTMEVNIPTVTAASPFDPRADADVLHKAMKGLGTNEKALITVLCRRTAHQRVAISQAYKSGYGKDLDSKLKSELSGNLEKLLVALSLPSADFLAHEMHEACAGLGTNESTLVQILCSGTNQEIREINAAYVRLYGHPMERDIKGDTSGTFKMLLVSLAQGSRDENQIADMHKVKEDAQRLYQAGIVAYFT